MESKRTKVTINQGITTIDLTLGNKTTTVNGETKTLNLAPQIKNNTTMGPIRFVSENLNCDVAWDSKTQTVSVTGKSETQASEEGTIIVKNPTIFAGVPSVSVEWLEKNLGVTTIYYEQYNRYVLITKDGKHRLTISENSKWINTDDTKLEYIGDYTSGTSKSTSKISVDIISKTFGYSWVYDKAASTLTLTKLNDELDLQEPVNGYININGQFKYLSNKQPLANKELQVSLRGEKGTKLVSITTDTEGYFSYKLSISDIKTYGHERVSAKYNEGTLSGSTPKNNFLESNDYLGVPYSIYISTFGTIYVD